MRQPLQLAGTNPPTSYSPAVIVGNLVFVSGQLGLDLVTEALEDGVEAQAARALENISALLATVDASLGDLVKTTVLLRDLEDGAAVAAVCNQYLTEPRPARSMYAVAALPRGALVEIEAIAILGSAADPLIP